MARFEDGYYTLRNTYSGTYLEVADGNPEQGTRVNCSNYKLGDKKQQAGS